MLPSTISYQAEIVKNKVIALPRIAAVNVGIHILDVDNKSIDYREHPLDIGCRDIERCFKINLPIWAAKPTKLADEIRAQTRLAAAESHTAICGEKIKLVDSHFIIKRLRRILSESASVAQRLRVQTIPTTERTTMKSHKRCHAVAVGGKTVTRNAYDLGAMLIKESVICHMQNYKE